MNKCKKILSNVVWLGNWKESIITDKIHERRGQQDYLVSEKSRTVVTKE